MKNLLNIKFSIVLVVATGLLMSSCLKNNKYYVDFGYYEPTLELPLAAAKVNKPFVAIFDPADTPTTYYIVLNVASMEKPKTPVTGTIALDVDYLNSYNAEQAAANPSYKPYELLPDSTYEISSMTATIQPGQREAWIPVKIWTKKLNLEHLYCLPITISNASIKISNWKHLMINVSAKNIWDGRYIYTGITSLGNTTNECCARLTMVGPYSVTMNLINYYSNQVVFTVDPATNKVEVSMTTLLPIATDPISNWDPATETFHVKWTSNNGARKYEEWYVKKH